MTGTTSLPGACFLDAFFAFTRFRAVERFAVLRDAARRVFPALGFAAFLGGSNKAISEELAIVILRTRDFPDVLARRDARRVGAAEPFIDVSDANAQFP